jgi:hypothetical protein
LKENLTSLHRNARINWVSDTNDLSQFDAVGRRLILDAFEAARSSGRANWTQMSLGVLKNRFLIQTNGEFDEKAWGISNFKDYVQQFPGLLQILPGAIPPIAELIITIDENLSPIEETAAQPTTRLSFVRNDLWNSIVDFSSEKKYVWRDGIAAVLSDAEQEDGDYLLPTLTRVEFDEWRSLFVGKVKSEDRFKSLEPILDQWMKDKGSANGLPTSLRRPWFQFLQTQVIGRLTNWFAMNGLNVPSELTSDQKPSLIDGDETERLRDLLMRCIRVMSRTEMESMQIPANVILRMRR